jgi:hypothetical protein
MRKLIAIELAVVGLAALTLGAGCPTIPQIEDRVVELAVGGSTTVGFQARGLIDVYNDTKSKDILEDVNLRDLLDDAGIDIADLEDVKLAGITYRVTKADPDPNRRIMGDVSAHRGLGADTTIVDNFDVVVNTATTEQTAPLTPEGVQFINNLLAELLREAKGGPAATNTTITYRVTGVSSPVGVPSDFDWELKIKLTIKGRIKVTMIG